MIDDPYLHLYCRLSSPCVVVDGGLVMKENGADPQSGAEHHLQRTTAGICTWNGDVTIAVAWGVMHFRLACILRCRYFLVS